jgi:aryl-alcohol dehydrogenase-like predicted oxidoreductase
MLDTARAYGDAEKVIGEHRSQAAAFEVVTKTQPLRASRITARELGLAETAFGQSLEYLEGWRVTGLLVHHCEDLLADGGADLWRLLRQWKDAGRVDRIGVSVYTPEQAKRVAAYKPDIIQLPLNVYDQRFIVSGALADLKAQGVEIHVRSAFLQGLLLMKPPALPPRFAGINDHHRRFHDTASAVGASALAAALGFCLAQPEVDRVVVGCESAAQLGEIIAAAAHPSARDFPGADFGLADETIIDPSRWAT